MFDMTTYYTFELERIAASSGASDEVRQAINEELVLRDIDPRHGLEYSPIAVVRKRTKRNLPHKYGDEPEYQSNS